MVQRKTNKNDILNTLGFKEKRANVAEYKLRRKLVKEKIEHFARNKRSYALYHKIMEEY